MRLLTVAEVARWLAVTTQDLASAVESGEFPVAPITLWNGKRRWRKTDVNAMDRFTGADNTE